MRSDVCLNQKFFEELVDAISPADIPAFLSNFKDMNVLYSCAIREVTTKLENLNQELTHSQHHNPIHQISHRIKHPESIAKKMQRKNLPLDYETAQQEIHDIAGIRVICPYIQDIYDVAAMLTKQDDITLLEQKDYIIAPKESGYRSLHLIITVPVFLSEKTHIVPVEVQIRTIAMDFWASLEHQLRYKTTVNIPEDIHKHLKEISENMYQNDLDMQQMYQTIYQLE